MPLLRGGRQICFLHPVNGFCKTGLSLPYSGRRKSKQALRDYKKVLVQLENLEISVGDQCRKEFTGMGWKLGRKERQAEWQNVE